MRYLVVGHGRFAEGLADAARVVMGSQGPSDIGLDPRDGVSPFAQAVTQYLSSLGTEKVTVFADLMGASPFNTVAQSAEKLGIQDNLTLLGNANLALVLEVMLDTGGLPIEVLLARSVPKILAPSSDDDTL